MKTYTFFGLVVLLCLVPNLGYAQEIEKQVLYIENFDSGKAGDVWELEQGWRIEPDRGNYVLNGASDADGYSAIYTKGYWHDFPGWTDFRMRFRIRLVKSESVVHLNFRMSKKGRYYVVFRAKGVELHKNAEPNVSDTLYINDNVFHSPSVWHIVDIVAEGQYIQVFVDGVREVNVSDQEPLTSGTIAFETHPPYPSVHIDDIVFIGRPCLPAGPPTANAPVNIEIIFDGDAKPMSYQLSIGLQRGAEIKTPVGATAFIGYADGSKIIMKPETYITIGSTDFSFGEIIAKIKGIFKVRVKYCEAKVEGTTFKMRTDETGRSDVEMIEGKIVLTPIEESRWEVPVTLQSGQQASIGRVEPPQPKPIPADRYRAIIQEINALQTRRATTKEIFVPLVVGLELDDAREVLRSAKLVKVKTSEIPQGDGPVGTVVRQDPEWGDSVEPDKLVTLWIKIKQ